MTFRTPSGRYPMVWMYHSINDYTEDPYQVTVRPDRFAAQLTWLRRRGLRGVSMRELVEDPRDAVGLTFDDGYADFAEVAVPILAAHGCTATVFVLPGRLAGSNEWDADGPRKPLMTAAQIRAVAAAGMEVASHGLRHRPMPELSAAELAEEVTGSRAAVASLTGTPPAGFAYPYGRFDESTRRAVKAAGYRYACAVGHPPRPDDLALPRMFVGDRDTGPRLHAKRWRHALRERRPS
ncbi:Peptidoglycan/xylan/chitin deacetylase, PgdA/CDA1 family [Amycolatopsis arida]|uniref:Peptidoglycan/xylan/chitin deacetylase, PgdA/CDA1 family n=1 Tax=Amycolatopsis arida TaxID=587909 RepID=A0A1I5XEH3_9PSEU|nr:polysaccharide deacetylase family protein [Amycolatopsis arida]TDX97501.1 peptidoglycan/xylan/chitin deacetylase (PgdA/CDA1 family) [Amycolatopsis arida]SFQ30360.1 Peptidoglycan/xylan/chitin deacetylase, PgdA/CDA1 family [Amycolatopsis arida]